MEVVEFSLFFSFNMSFLTIFLVPFLGMKFHLNAKHFHSKSQSFGTTRFHPNGPLSKPTSPPTISFAWVLTTHGCVRTCSPLPNSGGYTFAGTKSKCMTPTFFPQKSR